MDKKICSLLLTKGKKCCIILLVADKKYPAGVAELADAQDLKSCGP